MYFEIHYANKFVKDELLELYMLCRYGEKTAI